ncbi:COR domain-containing protein [Acidobacteriota bacterium]
MTKDLELLKQLEKEIGIKLMQVPLERITTETLIGFAADDNGHVKGLSLCDLRLTRVPELLTKFQQLEQLDLYKTQISDVSSLKELKWLTMLVLESNQISDISSIKELKELTELNLGNNQISDIACLKELKRLTTLYLQRNQISDISSLKELRNLKYLDLRDNKISQLPAEFLNLGMEIKWEWEGKDGIFLVGNPLEEPPVEIIKQGDEAILQYFKSLAGEKQALNEVKVLIVGEGAAGKTSLLKRLLGQDFNKNESQTHGININTWEITVDKTKIKVRLWDFGGQEIMHATHQFFLSKRSLYILVLDGRKDEKTEYWLNHIKSFGGDSPVMVAINKIDENPSFDVNRLFLIEKYPNIKGFYRLSCASGSGIDEFKKELTKELAAIELIRTTWAKSWFQVKKQLEEMKDNFISYETYQKICRHSGIKDEKEQDTLVDFLNDLGVILHFKEFHLQDTHVLEPKWITNAVYKIINSEILSTGKGVLELRRLGEILKAKKGEKTVYKYPPDKYKYIFQLMKKFELCFPIDEDKILVPDLLEVGEPEIDFPYASALKFRICYNFMPKSVMPRFIVRIHKDIKNKLSWRTGVVLKNNGFNATAVVKADQREKIITIFVEGAQKRDYFAHILHTFREINGSFEQIEVDECIPLPDKPKIAVHYLHLLRLERMGQAEFLPEKAERNYNVKELLEGIKPKKERQKEVEHLLRENKMVINVHPTTPVTPKESGKKKVLKTILKIAAAAAALIAFLAALFALIDSQSFREFWQKLIR